MEEQVDSVSNDVSGVRIEDLSDDEEIVSSNYKKTRKVAVLSDSDSNEDEPIGKKSVEIAQEDSDSSLSGGIATVKKRVLKPVNSSDSDSNAEVTLPQKSTRIHNKKTELANKFKNMSKKYTQADESNQPTVNVRESKVSDLYDSESSDDDATNKANAENEEYSQNAPEGLSNKSKKSKSAPQRMSAKQAMEQMHKIKSESCRMLREKRLHLPYHRPKQVTLKEIIDKKKIEFLPGAKKLALRMSEEQLKEYAKQLEEKEKDMLELCRSESDEEDVEENEQNSDNANEIETNDDNLIEDTVISESSSTMPEIENHEHTIAENFPLNDINTENADSSDLGIEKTADTVNKIIDSLDCDETDVVAGPSVSKIDEDLLVFQRESSSKHYSESQPIESKKLFLIPETISCSLPAQPKLSGTPGSFIDFTPESDPNELSSVNVFKQKFIYQASLKSAEDAEREQEKKLPPGTALMNFKRELENKISKQRIEEWTKKKNEEQLKSQQSNVIDDELSECEELLKEIDTEDKVNDLKQDEEEEEELEEDLEDVEMIYSKRKPKNNYIDDEAESEDDCSDIEEEDSEEDTENDELVKHNESGKRTLTRICKPFQDSDSSDDENADSKIILNSPKKSNKDLGDDENQEDKSKLGTNSAKTYNKLERMEVSDIFESQEDKIYDDESYDHLTLGQNCPSGITSSSNNRSFDHINKTPIHTAGRPDLISLISPMIKLSGIQNYSSTDNNLEVASPLPSNSSLKKHPSPDKWFHLQKKLFTDSETSDLTQGTQDIADLCSGKFPSEDNLTMNLQLPSMFKINSTEFSESEMTQNTENELLELCTGKFVGINTDGSNVQLIPQTKDLLLLEEIVDVHQNNNDTNNGFVIENENIFAIDDNKLTEAETEATIIHDKPKVLSSKITAKDKTIKSFFTSMAKNVNIVPKSTVNEESSEIIQKNDIVTLETILIEDYPKQKLIISSSSSSSSSDNELNNETQEKKIKVLKSKKDHNKRRAKQLQISDDESEEEDEENEDFNNSAPEDCDVYNSAPEDDIIEDREVEYDSEENEIEIQTETVVKVTKTKKSSEFFDHEAELTSEDEWKGSGDEDEKGLDEFEWEEGDADQFDEKKVSKELERIHRHQMLDQDNREIKLLQEMLIEDGDLEGGTRERKFKWKNVDNSIESGAVVGDDNAEEALEEAQTEEEWRKQRHERETFLRQMMEKENENISSQETSVETLFKTSIRTSLVRASMTSSTIKDIKTKSASLIESNVVQNETVVSKKPKELPSPVKKPFMMQNKFKGFLSRGEASLNRLALLAKTGNPTKENEPSTNLKPTNHRNFVFTAVSPPCNEIMTEDVKKVKRKTASGLSTPLLIKKMKLNDSVDNKFKKSLFDHID